MKYSLIMPTINRTKEVLEILESLATQEYRNFELIVVDQNENDGLVPII